MEKVFVDAIKDAIETEMFEHKIYIDDFAYILVESDKYEEQYVSEGKYEYRDEYYDVLQVKDDERVPTGLIVKVYSSRTGSYYTDYYVEKEYVGIFQEKEVFVEEVIIPAHTEVQLVEIK